nr:PREDICTED: uncharacterized protein LOC109632318 [Paralichthys olivaceus]
MFSLVRAGHCYICKPLTGFCLFTMMAVWACSGALLLVLLTGASYSYPANKGFDASSAYGSSNSANLVAAGSSWERPSSGFTDSGARAAAAKTASNPARLQTASRKMPKYSQPGVQNAPVAAVDTYPASDRAGYPSRSSAGPAQQQASAQEINWLVAPPSPFSPEERPSARRFVSSKPEALGSSYVGPPAPPQFQAGELSHAETSYENGDYESETEEQGIPPPPAGVAVADGPVTNGELKSVPGGGWVVYPYPIGYMFLTGRYPPGTLSHSRNSFEKGRDSWHDTHNIRYYYPANPSTLQAETIPTDSAVPQSMKWPSQPVKQSAGSAGYGQSGAVNGQNQPYRRVGFSRMTQPKHG